MGETTTEELDHDLPARSSRAARPQSPAQAPDEILRASVVDLEVSAAEVVDAMEADLEMLVAGIEEASWRGFVRVAPVCQRMER
jgi:hypothetical protein